MFLKKFLEDNDIFNSLKLRGGWGDGEMMQRFYVQKFSCSRKQLSNGQINPSIIIGYSPNTIGNPDLKWGTNLSN